MCFTTLLPTLVHVAWALSVWQTQKSEAMMRALGAAPNEADKIEIAGLLMCGRPSGAARAAPIWLLPLGAALWWGAARHFPVAGSPAHLGRRLTAPFTPGRNAGRRKVVPTARRPEAGPGRRPGRAAPYCPWPSE